ncbi:MAG TPA: hypothetical protein VF163_12545, partial [Micromonosporaceae bacterium]
RGHLSTAVSVAANANILAEVVRATLGRLASAAPVLVVLDDLQWVDGDTVAALRYVLRCPDRLPLLVTGGFRTGEPATARRLRSLLGLLRRERPAERVELSGLDPASVADLVRGCTGSPPEPSLAEAINEATAGNPFFIGELARLLTEDGRARVVDGELRLEPGVLGVPEGVREVILARCDHLSPSTRRVLTAAAACGREFDLATLESIAELATVDVLAAVEEAVASQLMVERGATPGRFRFVHGLVQEALYQEASGARRMRLHADIAAVLEARPGTAAANPARIAYHLLRGGPEVAERAVVAASRAGTDALRRHAYEEAIRHYAAALEIGGTEPSVRCRLRLELAGSRWRAGDTVTAREDYEAAAAEAVQAGRADLAARAVFGGTAHGATLGRCDPRAVGQLTRVLQALDPHDPFRPRLLARLSAELAGAADPRASELCQQALELASASPDMSTMAYSLNCQSWVNLGNASDRSGFDRADHMIRLAGDVGDRHMELEGRLWRCTYLLRAGRVDEAERDTAVLAERAALLRQPFYLRLPLRLRATLALLKHEFEQAADLAAEAYTIERRVHPEDAEVHAALHGAATASSSGDWSDLGLRLVDLPDPGSPHWTTMRAVELAAHGRVGPAARLLRPLLADDAEALRRGPLTAFSAALIVRACAADDRLGRHLDIDPAYRALLPWRGTHVVAGCAVASLGSVDACLNHLHRGAGPAGQIP